MDWCCDVSTHAHYYFFNGLFNTFSDENDTYRLETPFCLALNIRILLPGSISENNHTDFLPVPVTSSME
jgi:hypothetical protein